MEYKLYVSMKGIESESEKGERIGKKRGKQRASGRLLGEMISTNRFRLYCKSHHNIMYLQLQNDEVSINDKRKKYS